MAKLFVLFAVLAIAVPNIQCSDLLVDDEGYVLARYKRQMDCYKLDSYANGEIYRTSCTSFCFYHGYWPRCTNGHCTCGATPEVQSLPQPSTLPFPSNPIGTLPIPSNPIGTLPVSNNVLLPAHQLSK